MNPSVSDTSPSSFPKSSVARASVISSVPVARRLIASVFRSIREQMRWYTDSLATALVLRTVAVRRFCAGRSCSQLHDVRRDRRYKIVNVSPPCCESGAPFLEILKSVVDRRHAADRAAHMVEHLVDDMRREAERRHAGGAGAAKIVQSPSEDFRGKGFPWHELFRPPIGFILFG